MQFTCTSCGAAQTYEVASGHLVCNACGAAQETGAQVVGKFAQEHSVETFLALAKTMPSSTTRAVQCSSCGAHVDFAPSQLGMPCPFCGTPVTAEMARDQVTLQPEWVLPFQIQGSQGRTLVRNWISSRWFAPSSFKKQSQLDSGMQGVYTPFFTIDAHADTVYTGARGRRYTTTVGSGKNRRTVTHVSWTATEGRVQNQFDDVLVPASHSLPKDLMGKLHPWNLEKLCAYDAKLLAGFRSELPQIGLEEAMQEAYSLMSPVIDTTIRRDIGGDEQRIHSKLTTYSDERFRLALLPLWALSYRYQNKVYRCLVNGQTGAIQGERPWSWVKILLASLVPILIFFLLIRSNG